MRIALLSLPLRAGSTLREITGPLQDRSFQHDFAHRDVNAVPRKYKYPEFYNSYGLHPSPSDKVVKLAERIGVLVPEERRQIGPALAHKLAVPKMLLGFMPTGSVM